jgi:septum formation protein
MPASPPRLILASSSPYRRELLLRLHLPFETIFPHVEETPQDGELPQQLALRLAIAKAKAVSNRHPGCVVIGSDQVATLNGQPIGKPGDFAHAQAQLRALSGRTVEFYSALAVTDGKHLSQANIVTQCRFRALSHDAIDTYLRTEKPYDTAGSAKAEGLGIALMESMRSEDPTAIIGLPLIALTSMLATYGWDPLRPSDGTKR